MLRFYKFGQSVLTFIFERFYNSNKKAKKEEEGKEEETEEEREGERKEGGKRERNRERASPGQKCLLPAK